MSRASALASPDVEQERHSKMGGFIDGWRGIPCLPNGDGRFSRGFMATARACWAAGKVLFFLALGVAAGLGGVALLASGARILTSSDTVLWAMGTSAPFSARSEYPGRDPFSTRRAPQTPPTREETVYVTRTEALCTFGVGVLVIFFSLPFFGMAWEETAQALGFYPYGETKNPKE
jgi:hypothetical protein